MQEMTLLSPLQREIVELSYRNKLSHLSSTLSAAPIIEMIYKYKQENEVFVLSQGHAALALYCVLGKGQELLDKFGVQPHRSVEDGIYCTTGSLGMGLTVALGMAIAGRDVHCLISDGECAEGSVWETLRLAPKYPKLQVHVNFNGMSALGSIDDNLYAKLRAFLPNINIWISRPLDLPFTKGLESHYHVITDSEYETIGET